MQPTSIFFLLVTVVAFLLVGRQASSAPPEKAEYRVGDRLAEPKSPAAVQTTYKETGWKALVPPDWDPMKALRELDMGNLSDSDPRAMRALEQLRAAWDNAPVEPALNGARIRIPGFVVPLERQRDQITEFLLVPYFGACIHTPPPPSNQIIHVIPARSLKSVATMDAVWVSGVLETVRSETGMGNAGYRMRAEVVVPYKGR
jgi:hypothetical protein